jgi:S1-C subfamily serine protease
MRCASEVHPPTLLGTASAEVSSPVAAAGGSPVFVPHLAADVACVKGRRGVAVARLVKGGALQHAGVAVGDHITAINGVPLVGALHMSDTLDQLAAKTSVVTLSVVHHGSNHPCLVTVPITASR